MLPAEQLVFGPYLLDFKSRSLVRSGEPVGLSAYEFQVLHLLVRRPNVVHSKDALIRAASAPPGRRRRSAR
jgi:DNA-binding response OmpR family regulator